MKTKFTMPYMISGLITLGLIVNTEKSGAAIPGQNSQDSARIMTTELQSLAADTTMVDIDWASLIPHPVQALEFKKDVLYVLSSGDTIRRSQGTRAWRNNNPGNIRYANFARENGAIGKCGGFAVFPDERTGRAALITLLRSDKYNKLTIARAISKYAPPKENNVGLYRRRLQKMTGLSLNTQVGRLDSVQMERVADAICEIEGWREGRIEHKKATQAFFAEARKKSIQDSTQRTL